LTQQFAGKLLIGTENFFDQKEFENSKNWPKLDCRWVVWPEAYGPRMSLTGRGFVSRLIKRVIEGGMITIVNDGSAKVYPLFIADLIYQLTRLIFAPRTKNKAYRLKPTPIGCLTATLAAQKLVGGQLKISFVKRASRARLTEEEKLEEAEIRKPTDWDEGLRITWEYFKKLQSYKVAKLQSGKAAELNQPQGGLGKRKKFWWAVLIGAILLLAVAVFYPAGECYYRMRQIEAAFRQGNFGLAFRAARTAESNCQRVEVVSEKIRAGRKLAGLLRKNEKVFNQIKRLGQLIFQEKNLSGQERLREIGELTRSLKPELKNLYEDLALFDYSSLLPAKWAKSLGPARRLALELSQVVEYLPKMTGKDQNKSYLILLQNNNELRPTGGFIGSLAVVTFSQGQLVDFEVKDVYSLDGQLKGHVEPPAELKRYLGEANWYLRDVNWEADFPTVAVKAEWFLEKETGRQVDGVVGVNLAAAQKLLTVLGEIEISDFGEKINAQNLFERAEYHSEVNFFPGSTQKQDFLGGLARAVFERMMHLKDKESLTLLSNFYQSLQAKEIMLYVNQAPVQKTLVNLNWHGGWRQSECLETSSNVYLPDYLMIVEANVGVNKANYFVKRETRLAVGVDKNKLKNKLILTYQNQSPAAVFPGGNYKNYLRLVLPLGVSLEKVLIEGQEMERAMINENKVKDKWVVGFLVEVPISQRREVVVEYRREINSDLEKPLHYGLLVQKQSGAKEEFFNLKLTPGTGLVGFQFQPEARVEKGSYSWTVPLNQDLAFEAYLTK
jgi:hypothetical protein